MSTCNYCSLKSIRKRAKEEGMKVTLVNANWGMGGKTVYVHPPEVNAREIEDGSPEHEKYFTAWFMEVPKTCEC